MKSLVFMSLFLTAALAQASIGPKVVCTSTNESTTETVTIDLTKTPPTLTIQQDGEGITIPAKVNGQTATTMNVTDEKQGLFGIYLTQDSNGGITATSSSLAMGPEGKYSCQNQK